ncbi:MAG TPA: FecR domain-containing protein [Ramlibacter sp.]|nr:FecR domain-containing protein [Ramlibacter sp.]
MHGRTIHKTLSPLLLALACLGAGPAGAQLAGEVEFSRGVGFAQTPGQAPRTLGKGLPLREGDRLTTSEGASAIIKLEDGTRMTVRPNSEIVLQQYQFKENAPDNSMLMQLVRGGFRAVTGLISKNSPNAARIQTNTATIGIRGTDFDARLCTRDCGTESARVTESARPNAVLASAKVFSIQGEVVAVDASGQRRRLVDGGSIYPGDVIETAAGARGVLVFRDESRVSVGASSRFRVDNFVFDDQNAGEGRFLASLLRGSIRAVTGLIAKANNRNVGFATPTATIGIRGTEFTATCPGDCGAGNLSLFALLGSISFQQQGQTALQLLQAGQGLFITPTGFTPINTPPPSDAIPPGTVSIAPNTFGKQEVSDAQEGLFVFVRDGHIEVATVGDILHLGKGEAGFAGTNGETIRPTTIPKFIDFDKLPLPTTKNPLLVSVLQDNNIKQSSVCK